MKTIYSCLFTLALSAPLSAQFTLLEKWHGPEVGTTESTRSYDSSGVAISRQAGSSVTWDFSGFKTGTATRTIIYKAATAVPSATAFPGANRVGDGGTASTTYFKTDSVTTEVLGFSSGTANVTYTNSMIVMKWPMTFGGSFSDTYGGTMDGSPADGTITANCSGHGVVKLPGVSFSNCMQVHTHNMAVYQNTASSTSFTADTHSYTYFWDNQRFPLISINQAVIWFTSTSSVSSTNIDINILVAQGVTDYNFNAEFAIFPNPATEYFAVKLSNSSREHGVMQIADLTGKVVRFIELGDSDQIRSQVKVSDLDKGIYMVRTSLGDKRSVRKLVVE
jgi:hypothetical protein